MGLLIASRSCARDSRRTIANIFTRDTFMTEADRLDGIECPPSSKRPRVRSYRGSSSSFLSFSFLRSDTHSPSEKTRDEGENKTKMFNAKIFTALNWTRLSYLTFRHVYVKITNATFGGLSIYSLVLFFFILIQNFFLFSFFIPNVCSFLFNNMDR